MRPPKRRLDTRAIVRRDGMPAERQICTRSGKVIDSRSMSASLGSACRKQWQPLPLICPDWHSRIRHIRFAPGNWTGCLHWAKGPRFGEFLTHSRNAAPRATGPVPFKQCARPAESHTAPEFVHVSRVSRMTTREESRVPRRAIGFAIDFQG